MSGEAGGGVSAAPLAVIIPAYNASATIGAAIGSALAEKEVREVIVVDDSSSDETVGRAWAADDGSGRLAVHGLSRNGGPSRARNHGLGLATAPIVALLDADDFFLPGRIAKLLDHEDWDVIADNIVFVTASGIAAEDVSALRPPRYSLIQLDLEKFVRGNISRRGRARGELGFLKPLFKRCFLERHDLRYREELRFGEDYDFYLRLLANGARFLVTDHCGYGAVVRKNSLSAEHRTADLGLLARIDREFLDSNVLPPNVRQALERHERHVRHKYWQRRFLDERSRRGRLGALAYAAQRPDRWVALASSILNDKFTRYVTQKVNAKEEQQYRFLLN